MSAKHRAQPEASKYAWLGAGAITLGVGAALASGGIAHADDSSPADSPAKAVKHKLSSSLSHLHPTATADTSTHTTLKVAEVTKMPVSARSVLLHPVSSTVIPAGALGTAAPKPLVKLMTKVVTALQLNTPTPPSGPAKSLVWGLFRKVEDNAGLVPKVGVTTVDTPDDTTGVVTGTVGFTEPAGLPLTYAVTTDPTLGSVVLDKATGAYTYTPAAATEEAAAAAPVTDSFVVTASDGLAGTSQTVVVPVALSVPGGGGPGGGDNPPGGGGDNPGGDGPPSGDLLATITVGDGPWAVAVTPDGAHAYVSASIDGAVVMFDTATNTVVGSPIHTGTEPLGLVLSPDGTRLYVTDVNAGNVDENGDPVDDVVYVIDTATNTTVGAPIPVGLFPVGAVVTSDGSRVYVANTGQGGSGTGDPGTISVIDTAAHATVGSPITVGIEPWGLALSPDGNRLYVGNLGSHSVSAVDTATGTVSNTIQVGLNPAGLALSSDGARLYVANESDNTVSVIDTATSTVVKTVSVGTNPSSVAVSPDDSRVYVLNDSDATITVIDSATNTVIGSPITVTDKDNGIGTLMTISPDGTRAYVTDISYGTVTVIDLTPTPTITV
jgi:YVTN family beta-propeller protein/VCBS repeat-containing protein